MNTFTTVNISSLRSFTDPYISALSSQVQSAGQAASGAASQGYAIAHTTLKAMGENIGTSFTSLKTTVVNNGSSLLNSGTQALHTATAFGARTIQQIPTLFNQASQTAALTFKAMGDRSTRIGQNTVIARNVVVVCSIVALIAYGIFRWISYTNTLKAECDTLRGQLDSARGERDTAQTQHGALQAQLAAAETAATEARDALQAQLATAREERDAAQRDLATAQTARDAAHTQHGALQAQLAAAETAATQARDALQAQLTTARGEFDVLQVQLTNAEARIGELEATAAATEAALAAAEAQLLTLQTEGEAPLASHQDGLSDQTASGLVSSFIRTRDQQQPRTVNSDPSDATAAMPQAETPDVAPASFIADLPFATAERAVADLSASVIADTSVHSVTSLGGTPKRGGFDMTRSTPFTTREQAASDRHVNRRKRASPASGPHTFLRSPTAALSPAQQQRLLQTYKRGLRVDGSPAASSESGMTQASQRALRSPSAPVTPKSARFTEEQSTLISAITSQRIERAQRSFPNGTA
jgi:predicted  nucleic acid-binding Zn-ribbon protein